MSQNLPIDAVVMLAAPTIARALSESALARADFKEDVDWEGSDSLRLTIDYFKDREEEVTAETLLALVQGIEQTLQAAGDERLVHVNFAPTPRLASE